MTKNDLEQLIKMHGNEIYQFCCHLTGCKDDADDLYQDTLCKAYEIRKRIQTPHDSASLMKERNYCMGIAIRLYRNACRKKIRQITESMDDEKNDYDSRLASDFSTEELAEKDEMQAQIRTMIQSLPLKQRTVIYLYYFAELSVKDIGILLKIPVGTVKSRLSAAKNTLKKELEEKGYE